MIRRALGPRPIASGMREKWLLEHSNRAELSKSASPLVLFMVHLTITAQIIEYFRKSGFFRISGIPDFGFPKIFYFLLLTTRLEIAGAVNTSGERVTTAQGASRVVDGADMLVRGLFIPGEETVIDFTVFSERRAEKRVDASMVDPSVSYL